MWNYIYKYQIFFILFIGTGISYKTNAQNILTGDYEKLTIQSGIHIIKESVTVKGRLEIMPGAKIEFLDPGVLICEGEVYMNGDKSNKIEIYGNSIKEGAGFVIRGLYNSVSSVEISNSIFRGLQLPLLFDFGWNRTNVNIHDNYFINNTGKVTVIQVLNPPFNLINDTSTIKFNIEHNLFSGNNAPIYFEDLKSDHVKINIINNTFYGNSIYGYKNYNIATNILYGRADATFTRYAPLIENNSFVFNYLFDNIADTVAHVANFGVYGTEKNIQLKNNYLGANKQQVLDGIYDQVINYIVPKINFEPFLDKPNALNPSHIYAIHNLDSSILSDTFKIIKPLNGFILKANNKIDYSKSNLRYTYFKDDTSLEIIDTIVSYNLQPNNFDVLFSITKNIAGVNSIGYYTLYNNLDNKANYVPDVKFGFIAYLNEYRRRVLLAENFDKVKLIDSLNISKYTSDSSQNPTPKNNKLYKSRLEIGMLSGGSIFLGTISRRGNIFENDINLLYGLNLNLQLYSHFSAGISIQSFNLSNSDVNSNNNEQLARGMSFTTSVYSISPSLNYDFVENRLRSNTKKFKPTIGLGLDIVSFNPTGIYNGVVYNLKELGTGGQYADNTKKPYETLAFGYFLNFKLKYQINKFNSFGLHMSYHVSMSNYLDDVGPDTYPSNTSIINSKVKNIDAALFFSNPTSRNVTGQFRNSPDAASDSYLNFGVYFSRNIFN